MVCLNLTLVGYENQAQTAPKMAARRASSSSGDSDSEGEPQSDLLNTSLLHDDEEIKKTGESCEEPRQFAKHAQVALRPATSLLLSNKKGHTRSMEANHEAWCDEACCDEACCDEACSEACCS